jgi:hypothetical protein
LRSRSTNSKTHSRDSADKFCASLDRDLADWWEKPSETNSTFAFAWTGTNVKSRRAGSKIRLLKSAWETPRPDMAVRRIDFQATHDKTGPFLVAITFEP